jgi:DNA invertase Pin-like site-specific DNA recombinase
MSRWKSHHHVRVVSSSVEARKCLAHVAKILDAHYDDEGERLSEDELRLKAGIAATWLQKAETELAQARSAMIREIEHRETEADPETIRHRQFQAEVRRLSRQPRRRVADLVPDIVRLRDEGMVPAAIADTLRTSDSTVRRILKEAQR